MINVTENAVRQLRLLLEAQAPTERKGLRVQIAKGGCSGLQYEMSLDAQKAGDSIVEKDGVEFLVDGESADYLRGSTLDYRDGLTGTRLRGLARQFLHFRPTGAAGELQDSEEAAQDRSDQAL